ncbi:DUF2399 domain-containing protein [Brevibacillus antibioticus]|uniref:DUF2399 domain-containing protein n=1 Tax=Brevibacillus antibioticus TaxID=2570228 RepID=A0A4U2Y838_9BACL|nr:Wadjet anti-phage system protein JetD domain-containing protein [Brevibacillus antibioticus]TKI56796.1 DUF2399 domain-containing protein [Brevibacillus antibioticus]
MNYKHKIINYLLDRYEHSANYRGTSKRSVILKVNSKLFPSYWDDSSPDFRNSFHLALKELTAQNAISYSWNKHAIGIEVDKITLSLSNIENVYKIVDRTPKSSLEDQLRSAVNQWHHKLPLWCNEFIEAMRAALDSKTTLPIGLKYESIELLLDIFKLLTSLNSNDVIPKRVISSKLFGDSKYIENNLEQKLIKLLRKFHPLTNFNNENEELLGLVGISSNADHIFLSGPLTLKYLGNLLNLDFFKPDVGVPSSLIAEADIYELRAKRVLTIENKTTFYLLASKENTDTLLIYLGGFHNQVRQKFLAKLWASAPNIEFAHWGDIDLGGFKIFQLLSTGSGVPIVPYKMDLETYHTFYTHGQEMTHEYMSKLKLLLNSEEYLVFHSLIREMLVKRFRLEQEVIPL